MAVTYEREREPKVQRDTGRQVSAATSTLSTLHIDGF